MLLYALYALGALIAGALGLAATKPGAFRIQRSTAVNAPPDRIASNISDFHKWSAWSPWEQLDPNLKRSFSGAPSGKGAIYEWQGNKKVGSGRMEIIDTAADRITIKLDFITPFEAHNITHFHFKPGTRGTDLIWAMEGENAFVHKVFGLFMNMEKMVGNDFEKGLASLKEISEKSATV